MAYRGGALVKPIQVDYGAVAKIYSAGMARVQEIREGVLKERGEQSAALAKASDFVATGIQELDNLYLSAANIFREETMDGIEANDRGDITRSQLTALFSKYRSQAQQLSKMPEIMKKNIDEIRKDDSLSSLTLDQLTNTWFVDRNTAGSYVDENGQEKTLNRSISLENDKNKGILVKGTYEIYDPISKKVYQSAPIDKSLSEAVNPSYKKWEKIDDDHTVKKIKNFSNMLAERKFIDPNGDLIEFGLLQRLQDTNVYVRKENLDVFKNNVETHINSQDRRFWESYAYEQLGVRSIGHSGYSGPLDKEKIKPFNNVYLDEKGNKISFEQEDDVFSFNRNNEGEISLQKKTLELAKAHYRQKVYSSLQINQERMNLSQEELDKQQVGGNDISRFNYVKDGNVEQPVRYDREFFGSSIVNESIRKAKFQNQVPAIDVEQFEEQMARQGYSLLYADANVDLNFAKILKNSKAEFSGFNIPAQKKKSSKKLNEFLNITSSTGLKYDNINGIVVVTGIEGNPQIFVSGNAVATKQRSKSEFEDPKLIKDGRQANVTRDETINVSNALSKPLSPGQITKLYEQIRNYPAFQEFLNSSKAQPDFKKPEKAFQAIIEFAESLNLVKKPLSTP